MQAAKSSKLGLQTALTMDEAQVQQMKAAVLDYYNQHLAIEQSINEIQDFAHSAEETMLLGLPFLEKKA